MGGGRARASCFRRQRGDQATLQLPTLSLITHLSLEAEAEEEEGAGGVRPHRRRIPTHARIFLQRGVFGFFLSLLTN